MTNSFPRPDLWGVAAERVAPLSSRTSFFGEVPGFSLVTTKPVGASLSLIGNKESRVNRRFFGLHRGLRPPLGVTKITDLGAARGERAP